MKNLTVQRFDKMQDQRMTSLEKARARLIIRWEQLERERIQQGAVRRLIQSWSRGQYRRREDYDGQGLAEDRLFIYYSRAGKKKERTYLVWTQKGLEFIESLIK